MAEANYWRDDLFSNDVFITLIVGAGKVGLNMIRSPMLISAECDYGKKAHSCNIIKGLEQQGRFFLFIL